MIDRARIQKEFENTLKEYNVAGAQLAILVGDEKYEFASGMANVKYKIPVTPDTLFQVGSVTKILNSVLIFTLIEEGKFSLNEPIKKFIPSLKLSEPDLTNEITLLHLLTMTSGIDDGPYSSHGNGDDCIKLYVESLSEIPHVFRPGRGFGYCNAGAVIAGYAAECATGEIWDNLLKKRVLIPGGLLLTETLPENLLYHKVAVGHCMNPQKNWEIIHPWWISRSQGLAGSTLTSTAGDLVNLAYILMNSGKSIIGNQVLSSDSISEILKPRVDLSVSLDTGQRCAGPVYISGEDTHMYGHDGSNLNGGSRLIWFPDHKTAVSITANTPSSSSEFLINLTPCIIRDILGISYPKTKEIQKDDRKLNPERYIGVYTSFNTRFEISSKNNKSFCYLFSRNDQTNEYKKSNEFEMEYVSNDIFVLKDENVKNSRPIYLEFFGNDENAKAANLIHMSRASKRIS